MSGKTSEKLIKAGLYILMMAAIVLIVFLLMRPVVRSLLSRSGSDGQEPWEYTQLPGDYVISRENEDDIVLGSVDDGDESGEKTIIVGPYISAFWYDDRYIAVKQYPGRKDGNYDKYYYCVDTETDEISGPLEEKEFSTLCWVRKIRIEKWILTVPKPDGAVD